MFVVCLIRSSVCDWKSFGLAVVVTVVVRVGFFLLVFVVLFFHRRHIVSVFLSETQGFFGSIC